MPRMRQRRDFDEPNAPRKGGRTCSDVGEQGELEGSSPREVSSSTAAGEAKFPA